MIVSNIGCKSCGELAIARSTAEMAALALIAFELVAHPEQRAIDLGAVVTGQFDDPGLDDQTAEFDEVPRPLAAIDLPSAHVIPRPCRLMAVAGRPVALERPQRHGQFIGQPGRPVCR